MATDRIQLQALRSKDVLSGSTADLEVAKYFDGVNSPKLPTADQLEFGEIAVNIAKGYEVIAIKNYDGEVVYLPFNIASKLLAQEATLDELKEYAYSSIEELSGYTVSSFGSVNAFLDELNAKIDNGINSVGFFNANNSNITFAPALEIIKSAYLSKCGKSSLTYSNCLYPSNPSNDLSKLPFPHI